MKIVVLDDDPTGSQTVYGCPLILRWDQKTLSKAIRDQSPLLFILSNTRAMSPELAEDRTREICRALNDAFSYENINIRDVLFISRGDSTLRGHGVIEPDVIAEELGPFDGTFHVPMFFEGGRTTVHGIHLLNGTPVHLSNFARDKLFGYNTSYLPAWLQEKSKGRILADEVISIEIEQLNSALKSEHGKQKLIDTLLNISNNQSVVVDSQIPPQLSIFAQAIMELIGKKRFLFRSAASLINAFADLPVNKYSINDLVSLRVRDKYFQLQPGLVIVGSHVSLADKQLAVLLGEKNCQGLELPVRKIFRGFDGSIPDLLMSDLENLWVEELTAILESGMTPVLYTSRGEITFSSDKTRIIFGLKLAELMARLVSRISSKLGYIISKGGITTQILLDQGLKLGAVQLKGQILPGLSIVCSAANSGTNGLPVITFPGNLGDKNTLLKSWKLMEKLI
tara:strand:+ start:8451 stop:9809 length:1359 start_codon:yes stop_codon:yes gene_type:complete